MGAGEPIFEIDVLGEPNYMRRSWARHRHLNPDNLFSIVASGNSMEPTIQDGDRLIVHKQQRIEDNKLMMICFADQCYVKRTLVQSDGSVILRSDNSRDYHDLKVSGDDLDSLQVIGKVVDLSRNVW